jgi:hypothetical protein
MSALRGLIALRLLQDMTFEQRIEFIDRNMVGASAKEKMQLLVKLPPPKRALAKRKASPDRN